MAASSFSKTPFSIPTLRITAARIIRRGSGTGVCLPTDLGARDRPRAGIVGLR